MRAETRVAAGSRKAIAYAVGAALLVLVSYQILERAWLLQHLEMKTLHLLHLVRGIVVAGLVGAIVGSSAMRNALSAVRATEIVWRADARKVREQIAQLCDRGALNRRYCEWFVRMRWLACVCAAALAVGATRALHVLDPARLAPLAGAVGVLAAGNAVFSLRVRRTRRPERDLRIQIAFDLLVLTVFLQQSGGVENPLFLLYAIHVVIAGIVLPSRGAFVVAAGASLLLTGLSVSELLHWVPHYEIALSPHPHHGAEVHHASYDPFFVIGRTSAAVATFHVLAAFVVLIARELRGREGQLVESAEEMLVARLHLEGVIETSLAGIAVRARTGELVWTNRRYRDWLGLPGPELAPGLPDKVAASAGSPEAEERTVPGRDGRERHLVIATARIADSLKDLGQTVEVVHDVTRLKSVQSQLVRAGKMAAIGEMAGRVAHEINNPAGIIAAKAELLLDRGLSPELKVELAKVQQLALRITDTVRTLLTFARPAVGARSPDDLNRVAREARDLMQGNLARQRVAVALDLAEGRLPVVVNASEITQVLLNLMNNAADAMPDGGRVTIATRRLAGGRPAVALEVTDTGPGVPAAARACLFEPFFTTKPAGKGTGLGLAISRGIVEQHGGTLSLENVEEVAAGARFELVLPEQARRADGDPGRR